MATAGRLMARLMRGRGHSPAASGVYLVGRSRTRPRLYRRSHRAGSKPPASTDLCLTAESTARPYPTRHTPVLMDQPDPGKTGAVPPLRT